MTPNPKLTALVAPQTIHCFEKAELGIAPFRFVRLEIRRYRAHPDAPSQPGGTCAFCSEAIVECCFIRDANGTEFMVGNVCVGKTGDRGLIDPIKRELNRLRTEERHARERERIITGRQLLERPEIREKLTANPHPFAASGDAFWTSKTQLDWALWMMSHAGNAGCIQVCRVVEALVKSQETP